MSLVIDLIDLVAKHKSGELRCPATALIAYVNCCFSDAVALMCSKFYKKD